MEIKGQISYSGSYPPGKPLNELPPYGVFKLSATDGHSAPETGWVLLRSPLGDFFVDKDGGVSKVHDRNWIYTSRKDERFVETNVTVTITFK